MMSTAKRHLAPISRTPPTPSHRPSLIHQLRLQSVFALLSVSLFSRFRRRFQYFSIHFIVLYM